MNFDFYSYIVETIICVSDDMSEKFTTASINRQLESGNIIFRMLHLLAEEHLISLEEELKGKELFQRKLRHD